MYLRKGDTVRIITGKQADKSSDGVIEKILPDGRIIVENKNMATKHMKPNQVSAEGGRIEIEKPIHASNVMLVDPETNETTRVGFKVVDGKKVRISKKTGKEI